MIHPSECQGRRTLTGIMGVNEECQKSMAVSREQEYQGSREF